MAPQTLLLTPGDPAGLGPELICRLLSRAEPAPGPEERLLILCPLQALEHHCRAYGLDPFWTALEAAAEARDRPPGVYAAAPKALRGFRMRPGVADVEGGRAAARCLLEACKLLRSGAAQGLVTGPLSKVTLQQAGYPFPGHTEFLAQQAGLEPGAVCMHLAGPKLRVSLATTHLPLKQVAGQISAERVLHCLRLTWRHLGRLGARSRPVAVCGLNPHAGEEGRLGLEDLDLIAPAVRHAQAEGIEAAGPLPGDTAFHRARRGEFSAVLAMYHDQGLAPLKLLHFGEAVNVTLGLPFVRTSVDHGTGYDLVGTGRAGLSSLARALELARLLL